MPRPGRRGRAIASVETVCKHSGGAVAGVQSLDAAGLSQSALALEASNLIADAARRLAERRAETSALIESSDSLYRRSKRRGQQLDSLSQLALFRS